MNTCLQCGKRVNHCVKDGQRPNGSAWMKHMDNKDLFCTMRCAAMYGLNKAEQYDARAKARKERD